MRRLIAIAAALATCAALPGVAQAAEGPLTGQEIRDIAGRGLLWCEEYQAETDDCGVVTLLRAMPDGRLATTSTLLLQDNPRLQVYIADIDQIDGDRLCSKVEPERARFTFTLDGDAVAGDQAAGLTALFQAQLADMAGKTMCQAFFHTGEPNVIREEITVDGERQTELESTYHLREADSALNLRAQFPAEPEDHRTQL
jgi:hypothetical protein